MRAPASAPLRLLLVGQSHAACVQRAAPGCADALAAAGLALEVLVMNAPAYDPHFLLGPGGEARWHPRLQADLAAAVARADVVLLSVGGTAQWVLGLVEHPRPFDFALDGEAPSDPARERLPAGLVRATLEASNLMVHQRALREALAAMLPRPLWHLASPPPARDEHLAAHPGRYAPMLAEHGPAPAALRRKLWRLHTQVVAEHCAALGIDLLGVPPAAVDADGLLVPEATEADPTHAGPWYGRQVIGQIARLHRPGFAFAEAP